MSLPFVHLHVHTKYSKADGAIDIKKLAKKVEKLGQSACAITDHGNMMGTVYFHNYMKEYGINPIMGYEAYTNDDNAHLILLAKNNQGFRNLVKICSIENMLGWVKSGKFAKGNLNLEEVKKAGLGNGIIALTACLGGTTSRHIQEGRLAEAESYVTYLQSIFEEVYIELQHNTVKEQNLVNYELVQMANRMGVELVITKDAHYLNQEDWEAHDVLLAKQINKEINDPTRWRFPGGPEYYICDADEMERYCDMHNIPKTAITNTQVIADKCHVELFGENGVYNSNLFPDYDDVPKGYTQVTYLRKLAMDGLIDFINTRQTTYKMDIMTYINRLNYELDVIEQTGFAGYFLILWDFMKYCKEYRDSTHPNGIGTGAGRG